MASKESANKHYYEELRFLFKSKATQIADLIFTACAKLNDDIILSRKSERWTAFEDKEKFKLKINKYINKMGAVYDGEGSKIITEEFFDILSSIDEHTQKSRIETAIKRAERNYKRWNHHSPALEESTTTVYKLINEIMKFK